MKKSLTLLLIAVALAGCASQPLVVEVSPDTYIKVPQPEKVKMMDGIWSVYANGSILATTDYYDNATGADILNQVYGSATPTTDKVKQQKQLAAKDAHNIKSLNSSKFTAYLVDHVNGYQVLVFSRNGTNAVTFVTAKGVSIDPVVQSIKE